MKKISLFLILILVLSLISSCKAKPIIEKSELEKENKIEEDEILEAEKEEEPEKTIDSEEDISKIIKIEKKGYVKIDNLNVRKSASIDGQIILSIDKGLEIYVIGKKDNWYYIEYAKDQKGWAHSNYIQF